MKKLFLCLSLILLIASRGDCAVTTIDGAITLDFYEDTQFGNNRWILDMKVNDFDGPGGVEAIYFNMIFFNESIEFNNPYNPQITNYLVTGYYTSGTMEFKEWSSIGSNPPMTSMIPVNTNFIYYAIPNNNLFPSTTEYTPVIGEFYIRISGNGVKNYKLTGPIGFNTIPEPMCMALFCFGILLLRLFR